MSRGHCVALAAWLLGVGAFPPTATSSELLGWRDVGQRLRSPFMRAAHVSADPTEGGRLYAVAWVYGEIGRIGSRLMQSDDGGATWTSISPHGAGSFPGGELDRLVVDPRPGGSRYGLDDSGIASPPSTKLFRFDESSREWVDTDCSGIGDRRFLVFPPAEQDVVYCYDYTILNDGDVSFKDVFRSDDAGISWQPVASIPRQAFDGAAPVLRRIGQRLLLSTDGLGSFQELSPPASDGVILSVLAADALTYFVLTDGGELFATTDGAQTWIEKTAPFCKGGLFTCGKEALAWDALGGRLLGFGLEGLFESFDGGSSWLRLRGAGLFFPARDVLLDADRFFPTPHSWVYDSYSTIDGGNSYEGGPLPVGEGTFDDRGETFAIYRGEHPRYAQWGLIGLQAAWQDVPPPPGLQPIAPEERASSLEPSPCVDLAVATPQSLFCLHRSLWWGAIDGTEWRELGSPLDPAPKDPVQNVTPLRLAIPTSSGDTDKVVWVERRLGDRNVDDVVVSRDRGDSWELAEALEPRDLAGLFASRIERDAAFVFGPRLAARAEEGASPYLLLLDAFGASLEEPQIDLTAPVTAMTGEPNSSRLWLGTADGSVYQSSDCGRSWSAELPEEGGLPSDAVVWSLRVNAIDNALLAATSRGLFRADTNAPEEPIDCSAFEEPGEEPNACQPEGTICVKNTLLEVTAQWGKTGAATAAHPVSVTPNTLAFWFFGPDNLELIVKALDGCAINGHYWVYAAGLTNLPVEIQVFDLVSDNSWSHATQGGAAFAPVADIRALPCPP